ncbi:MULTISPECIES: DUF4257 domain-containing protein [Bacillus]|uniref:DUF4257 domain-containing protein n=1 Tax=Bacillus yunxiaonensis TaxID=3127665 RepID=A0ABU8G280_9BACI
MDMYSWLTALLVGGITGFVAHLINHQGKLLLPRRLKTFFHLGFFADIITGSLAALLGLVLFDATTMKEIIKVAIVTAISGQTFLLHQALGGEQAKNMQMNKANEKIQEIDKLLKR